MRLLAASLVAFGVYAGVALAQTADAPTAWYTIVADSGPTLGHVSVEVETRSNGRNIIESQQVYLREHGAGPHRATTRTIMREDASGRTVSIDQTWRAGRFWARTRARIGDGRAEIERETPNGVSRETVDLPTDVRFDDGEALLQSWAPETAPRLEFLGFDSDSMSVERVVVEATGAADAQGRLPAVRWRYEGDDLRGVSRLVLERGRVVEMAQPMFGETFRVRATDRANALRSHPPYPVIRNMAAPSPFRISAEAREGHIRYRYAFRDNAAFPLPQTGEQRTSAEAGFVTLEVCADCGPGLPTDAGALSAALRPTVWLQSDHPRLQALAARVRTSNDSDARKMELLLERALPFLEQADFNGHYSALDTLERRAGDCTEAAVLLAALGRAAGIPTRVASGFWYTRRNYLGASNAFIPHSWTLAYVDGRWRSFDLSLREFDSTHVALTIGDGDPRSIAAAGQLASLLRLDSLAEVRVRGS